MYRTCVVEFRRETLNSRQFRRDSRRISSLFAKYSWKWRARRNRISLQGCTWTRFRIINRAGSVIIETHGLDTHGVSLKLESTSPVWSYPSFFPFGRLSAVLSPCRLITPSLLFDRTSSFSFDSAPTSFPSLQRQNLVAVQNSCASKHGFVVFVRISENRPVSSKLFSLSLLFSAYYGFFLWMFAFDVHRVHRAAPLDFHRSILDVTLLPSRSYIPVKRFEKQFSKL